MGTMIGHVGPGAGFLLIGIWHMLSHIRLHLRDPRRYSAPAWFRSRFVEHLELYLIMAGSALSISMELFIGPDNHQPLDPQDWTIPSNHLHNFEHSSISLTFLLYAAVALAFDRAAKRRGSTSSDPDKRPDPPAAFHVVQLLAGTAFAQQLLMFHLHSTDHMGVEGQYHWLLQLVIAVSLATTLLGAAYPTSFALSFVRSASVMFQGLWLIVMGFALWTPGFIAKGCFMNLEEGHLVVRCHGHEALHRAKALVNIQFSWLLALVAAGSAMVYLFMANRVYKGGEEYVPMVRAGSDEDEEEDDDDEFDLEGQKDKKRVVVGGGIFSDQGTKGGGGGLVRAALEVGK